MTVKVTSTETKDLPHDTGQRKIKYSIYIMTPIVEDKKLPLSNLLMKNSRMYNVFFSVACWLFVVAAHLFPF